MGRMSELHADLFDTPEARRRKEEGQRIAADNSGDWLERARSIAVIIARGKGHVTSDDIWATCPPPVGNENAMGSVFKQGFIPVDYVQSQRPSAHARMIRRWRLK